MSDGVRLAVQLTLGTVGFGLLWYAAGPAASCGAFLMLWAHYVEKH